MTNPAEKQNPPTSNHTFRLLVYGLRSNPPFAFYDSSLLVVLAAMVLSVPGSKIDELGFTLKLTETSGGG